jgi:CrcB protein
VVALCGALGAVSRYGVSVLVARFLPERVTFPVATFLINIVGSFFLAVVLTLVTQKIVSEEWRYATGVGFLGAFTTFSAFSAETDELLRHGAWATAALYVGCSVVFGVAAAVSGRVLVLRLTA